MTGELNPFREMTVIVTAPLAPGVREIASDDEITEKSG
jgi:hypothetical protein